MKHIKLTILKFALQMLRFAKWVNDECLEYAKITPEQHSKNVAEAADFEQKFNSLIAKKSVK